MSPRSQKGNGGEKVSTEPRLKIIVDSDNLHYAHRNLGYRQIDHSAFIDILCKGNRNTEVRYYIRSEVRTGSAAKFFDHLERCGYRIIGVDRNGADDKDRVDHRIISDFKELARDSDEIILVSGDRGFKDSLDELVLLGKIVKVVSTPQMVSSIYRNNPSYEFINLTEYIEQIGTAKLEGETESVPLGGVGITLERDAIELAGFTELMLELQGITYKYGLRVTVNYKHTNPSAEVAAS